MLLMEWYLELVERQLRDRARKRRREYLKTLADLAVFSLFQDDAAKTCPE